MGHFQFAIYHIPVVWQQFNKLIKNKSVLIIDTWYEHRVYSRFKVQGSRPLLVAGAVPAAALPAPTRLRARDDEPASMVVIVCATSYGIDVVVIAVIIVLQFFAAHCSNHLPLCLLCLLDLDAAVCDLPRTVRFAHSPIARRRICAGIAH